jgi:hypothetical protein
MQDAYVGGWARESHLSAGTLESLRDLNHQFLDLAAARTGGVARQVSALSAAQRAAAAGCPYALFDLRFQDDAHWRERLQGLRSWYVADRSAVDDQGDAQGDDQADSQGDDKTVGFVRLALFYAWHVASSEGLKAQLLLGMNGGTAVEFRRITLNQLPALAAIEAKHLSARWSGCTTYWNALTAAARRTDLKALRRVQLQGLQLAAAARLPGP